jgi:plastocyanin
MRKIAAILFALVSASAFANSDFEHIEHLKMMMHAMSQHGAVIPQPEAIQPMATQTINITARCFSFSPSAFTVNQGDMVTININVPATDSASGCNGIGHGLLMDTYVEQGVSVSRGQTKSVTFIATTTGMFAWVCTQSNCGTGHSSMFGQMTVVAQTNPAPTISSLAPNNGPPAGGTAVTISGSNFGSGATVKFGTNAATNVNVVSSTSITATTPAHNEGAVDVTVTNSDGQIAIATQGFTYVGLKITSVSPNSGSTSGGTNVTIAGSAFQSGATVKFGARSATNVNVVDSSTIIATSPLGPANEQLQVDVVVTNPDGTSATLHPGFTYSVPPLQITSISPNTLLPGGGTVVTITGAGFTTALNSSVTFGGVPATNVTILDPVTLQATAPAHALGTVDVAVTMGGLNAVKTGGATYVNPPPRHRAAKH